MEDLSLHILDIVENSIRAGAKEVDIHIDEDLKKDWLEIEIRDNGKGMDLAVLELATDPFFTTQAFRKVGLGLSLLKQAAKVAGGDLTLSSGPGRGTTLKVGFQHSHIDRKPMGDMAKTLKTLIITHPEIHFRFRHRKNGQESRIDSHETSGQKRG